MIVNRHHPNSQRYVRYILTRDASHGKVEAIIESGATFFVSAVGVPPKKAVDRLHEAGIPVMNMIGHPKHVKYALAAGVDIICCQGTEAGGHTGDIASSVLIPACVDACRGRISSFTGREVPVVAAGGIYDGRGLAAALCYGAAGVWVGTRFVAAQESGAPPSHKDNLVKCGFDKTIRTTIFSGRPMRVMKTPYINEWETERVVESADLRARGIIPMKKDLKSGRGGVCRRLPSPRSARD